MSSESSPSRVVIMSSHSLLCRCTWWWLWLVKMKLNDEPAPRSQFKLQSPKISCDLGAEIHLLKVLSSQLQITQLVSKTRPLPHCIQQPPSAQRRRVGLDGWFWRASPACSVHFIIISFKNIYYTKWFFYKTTCTNVTNEGSHPLSVHCTPIPRQWRTWRGDSRQCVLSRRFFLLLSNQRGTGLRRICWNTR